MISSADLRSQMICNNPELAQNFILLHMPSSVVAHIHYDAARHVLQVRFLSGSVYEYMGVPESIYRAMKTAFSKGTYLNRYVKGHYHFKKLR